MLCSILFACNSPTPLELSWEGCAVRLWFLCHPGLWLLSGMGHGSSCWLRSARLIISLILPWPGGGRRRRGIPRKSGCLLSASADPWPKAMSWAMGLHLAAGCLASSSPHGGDLRAQGQSWNLGWQEVGPAERPAREASERCRGHHLGWR